MSHLEELIADAQNRIRACQMASEQPAIMCSFGKDSMALLHLAQSSGLRFPVIFHRDPWFPLKYTFADQVISDWELEVWDYPPIAASLWEGKEIMAVTSHYQIGTGAPLLVPKNILEPVPGERYLCGLKDFLLRPKGTFEYPWDAVMIGHKDSDRDQIAGAVPLHVEVKINRPTGPDAHFPLKRWTDEDVWEYIERFDVPVQHDRYVKKDGVWGEHADKTCNSDYVPVCIRCLDRRQTGAEVFCPTTGDWIPNISEHVNYVDVRADYFGEKREVAPC